MPDITNTHLEAAIIDQKVAGQFAGEKICFRSRLFVRRSLAWRRHTRSAWLQLDPGKNIQDARRG